MRLGARTTVICALSAIACGGGSKTPTAPTPVAQSSRIIELEGNLQYGNILVGSSFEAVLRIHNRGNATLNITGMTGPAGYAASWTSGAIAPGTSQPSTIRFSPTEAKAYNGTVTVNGDQTGGTNTISISGSGVLPPRPQFTKTGVGDSVFDMPVDVSRVRIIGVYNGRSSNFIVRVAGRLIVNEIIGTDTPFTIGIRYQGDHLLASGGVVQITNSSNVQWSFEELGR